MPPISPAWRPRCGLMLLSEWRGDDGLRAVLTGLPDALGRAVAFDSPEVRTGLGDHGSMFTLGRGPCLAIANEVALKFDETRLLHAASYSSAEVLQSPVAVVRDGFPARAFAAGDAAETGLAANTGHGDWRDTDWPRNRHPKGSARPAHTRRDAAGFVIRRLLGIRSPRRAAAVFCSRKTLCAALIRGGAGIKTMRFRE